MKRALLLAVAIAIPGLATAQTITLYEPVPDPVMLPIERNDAGVVRAQFIKPGDVSPEEYQRLLDEADKVRAFQGQQPSYITVDRTQEVTADAPLYSAPVSQPLTQEWVQSPAPQADIFAEATAPRISATLRHTVVKGDTLYNIAKRNGVSVDEIRSANGMSDNGLQLGQTLMIPSSVQTIVEPVRANSAVNSYNQVLQASAPVAGTPTYGVTSDARPYAVTPGDTLYSIAKRACTSVTALQNENALSGTNIAPGQKLALPAGHCLN